MPKRMRVYCHCKYPHCKAMIRFSQKKDRSLKITGTDSNGNYVDVLVDRKNSRWLMWWFIKNFWRK